MTSPIKIAPMMPSRWVNDGDCSSCRHCGAAFGLLSRRHHCRMCGEIFCATCSNFSRAPPSFIYCHKIAEDGAAVRLCASCSGVCDRTREAETTIFTLSRLPLKFWDLRPLLLVNRTWRHAMEIVVQIFRAIPLKVSYQRFSSVERALLRTHAFELQGHPAWLVQMLRAFCTSPRPIFPSMVRHCPPTRLLSKRPESQLCIVHFMELLCTFPGPKMLSNRRIRNFVVKYMKRLPPADVAAFTPWFLTMMGTGPEAQRFFDDVLLPMARGDIHVAYAVHFECDLLGGQRFFAQLQRRLAQQLTPFVRSELDKTVKLVAYIDGVRRHLPLSPLCVPNEARLPHDPNVICVGIGEPRRMSSATKPYIIPLRTSAGDMSILTKADDLRKDRCVMLIARMLEDLCDIRCLHYGVFVRPGGGYVEMLPNAKTLYSVQGKMVEYIFNAAESDTVSRIRDRFMHSLVGSCMLSYMLGVQDRHLENMLLVDGEIAHIDFSFILNNTPKLRLDMRITPDCVRVLGGVDSRHWAKFKHHCSKAYRSMRLYINFWYTMMTYLAHCGLTTLENVRDIVEQKLLPGELDSDAALQITKVVESSSGDRWTTQLADFSHAIFKMDI